jgi:hypothetical protein
VTVTPPDPTEFNVSAFDLADQAERHRVTERDFQAKQAAATAKAERRSKRIEYGAYVLITAIVGAVLLVGFHEWWLAVRGPSARDTLNQQVQLACVEKGGTWTTIGDSSTAKTCVFLKEVKP